MVLDRLEAPSCTIVFICFAATFRYEGVQLDSDMTQYINGVYHYFNPDDFAYPSYWPSLLGT